MPEHFLRRRPHCGFALFAGCLLLLAVTACASQIKESDLTIAPSVPLLPAPLAESLSAIPGKPQVAQSEVMEDLQAIDGANEKVQQAIRNAARTVGIETSYLVVVAARESSFDPRKHAHRTSATGLYQFTASTWLRTVRAFGERHGLAQYARQIEVDHRGVVSMRDAAARAKLLRLRADPRISALMAAELARDNEARLARLLGRPAAASEIYIAHLLGVTEAARVIEAARSKPQTLGVQVLPAAARANPDLFAPRGRIASANTIVSKLKVYYLRQELRFADKIGANRARAQTGLSLPYTVAGRTPDREYPVAAFSASIASVSP